MSLSKAKQLASFYRALGATYTNSVKYTNSDFICGVSWTENDSFYYNVIAMYTTMTNKWRDIYTTKWRDAYTVTAICVEPETDTIYMTFSDDFIGMLDINTQQLDRIRIHIQFGNNPALLMVKGKLHIIGGKGSNKHYIWEKETNKLKSKHHFGENIHGHKVIHWKAKNSLIMLGGYSSRRYCYLQSIRIYSMKRNKWTTHKQQLFKGMSEFGCVMSMDEQYIIILGGKRSDGASNRIYVMDLQTMTLTANNIKCPATKWFNATLMMTSSDQRELLLVDGYVKQVIDMDKSVIIPHEIIELITYWCGTGYVHMMETYCGKHWRISVFDLLQQQLDDD